MQRQTFLIAILCFILGALVGSYVGRRMLEAHWAEPMTLLSGDQAKRLLAADADPVPMAGARILKEMPLQRARAALKDFVAKDSLVVSLGSVSDNDDGRSLTLRVENRGSCQVRAFSGVAYGFDAWGRPAKMNKSGENFIAFSAENQALGPKGHVQSESKMRYPETASLALAQVDAFECDNGMKWTRQ